jgi:hypothetical protein
VILLSAFESAVAVRLVNQADLRKPVPCVGRANYLCRVTLVEFSREREPLVVEHGPLLDAAERLLRHLRDSQSQMPTMTMIPMAPYSTQPSVAAVGAFVQEHEREHPHRDPGEAESRKEPGLCPPPHG